MNFRIIIILLTVPLFFEKRRCAKECLDETYSFQIYVKGYPSTDSVFVNDTIWFEINESTKLTDLTHNNVINFSNATNLGSVFGADELLGNSQREDAVSDFNYALISGMETASVNPARFKEYIFKEETDRYIFKLGIVPKKPGYLESVFLMQPTFIGKMKVAQRHTSRFYSRKQINIYTLMIKTSELAPHCPAVCIVSK